MSVSDFNSRHLRTVEFLNVGLGASLTRSATSLFRFAMGIGDIEQRQVVVAYACATIIERVFWIGYGFLIGYFEDIAPISLEEQVRLQELTPALTGDYFPAEFQETLRLLTIPGPISERGFFEQNFSEPRLSRPVIEWHPAFRALIIVSERLTESLVTSFFLFLRSGVKTVNDFSEGRVSPEEIVDVLSLSQETYLHSGEHKWQAFIMAGFMRFTEVLCAMEDIIPNTRDMWEAADGHEDAMFRFFADRSLLLLFRPPAWRIPQGKREGIAFTSVLLRFADMVTEVFEGYPQADPRWFQLQLSVEVERLSQRFFDLNVRKTESVRSYRELEDYAMRIRLSELLAED